MKAGHRVDVIVAFLSSARFLTVLTTATIGSAALAFPLQQTIGWAGLIGILGALILLWALILVVKRGEIEWSGLLPISLMIFIGWAAASVLWSHYQWATLGGVTYLLAFSVLGVSVALMRDTIQIVRAFGDVLRLVLVGSLAVEIVSGLLIDRPIAFLDVSGHLSHLGPLQGLLGARNQLGIVAVIALITFATELRTRSVSRTLGISSTVLAAVLLVLSQSPVAIGASAVVGLAAAALYGLRKVAPERRHFWQLGLLAASVVTLVLGWTFRSPLIGMLDATRELSYRLNLWRRIMDIQSSYPLEGWGWVGAWRLDLVPFVGFKDLPGGAPLSAANAFFDVWLQLGVIGLFGFLVLIALAFVRSWLLAVARRSVVFTWPALILLTLIMTSLAESSILIEFGFLTLVVCTVKASRELSWRQAFTAAPGQLELPHLN